MLETILLLLCRNKMSTTTTEQPKRSLEDFKKLGADLHQRLLLARTAPLLLNIQPQPEPLPAKKEPAKKEPAKKERRDSWQKYIETLRKEEEVAKRRRDRQQAREPGW